jgi:hypothetical protein
MGPISVTSEQRLKANKENARKSTGPRTKAGKKKASANARRHGVTSQFLGDPAALSEIERLAIALAGNKRNDEQLKVARTVAEAEFDLLRVRTARAVLMNAGFGRQIARTDTAPASGWNWDDPRVLDQIIKNLPQLARLERYERRALARRRKAARALAADQ